MNIQSISKNYVILDLKKSIYPPPLFKEGAGARLSRAKNLLVKKIRIRRTKYRGFVKSNITI